MNLRDIKLAIACGYENIEIKELNKFFDDLFKDVKISTHDNKTDLTFMKCEKCLMVMNLESKYLWCVYDDIWKVLKSKYSCTYLEAQDILQYKVEEAFNYIVLKTLLMLDI